MTGRRTEPGTTARSLHLGTLATSITIQACGVVTGIVTARSLGPEARGAFVAVLLWPTIVSNLGLVGANWAVARAVAADPGRAAHWTRVSVVVGLLLSAVFATVGYLLMPLLLPTDKQELVGLSRVCLLLVPLDILSQMLLATEHGQMRWRRYNALRVVFYLVYASLVVVLWLGGRATVTAFAAVFLGSHLLVVLLRLALQWRVLWSTDVRLGDAWRLLRSGLPFVWSTATNLMVLHLDKMLVVALLSTDAVGLYAAAVTFSFAHSAFGETLGITAFAQLASERDPAVQARLLAEAFRQAAVLAFGLGAVLAALMPMIVPPLFGEQFAEAIGPAMILTVAASLAALRTVLNQGLKGAGRPAAGVAGQLVGAAAFALVVVALRGSMELTGIAVAAVASGVAQVAVLLSAAAFFLKVSPGVFLSFNVDDLRSIARTFQASRVRYS